MVWYIPHKETNAPLCCPKLWIPVHWPRPYVKKCFPFVANFSCKEISKGERTITSRNTIRSSIGWGKTLIISPKYIRSQYIIKTSVSRRLNILSIMGGGGGGVIILVNIDTYHWHFTRSLTRQASERLCICVRGIDFATFYNISVWFWNCSYSVVFFYFSFYFRQEMQSV